MDHAWISFLRGVLKVPGAKIDREAFLRKTFKGLGEEDMKLCLSDKPGAVVPKEEIDKAADQLINSHTLKVAAISTASGIPGGLAMLASIPADLANYYFHVVAIGQKLGYLYGFPDMVDANGCLTSEGEVMLTAFIGVMNKVKMANELVKKIAIEASMRITQEAATRIASNILSKQGVAQAAELVAQKLGAQITSRTLSRGITKAVPLLSGIICGSITYATFKPQAKRLRDALRGNLIELQ